MAPQAILRAGNETIYVACVACRAAAYENTAEVRMVGELMDAIHDIAHALVNWKSHHSAEYIRSHFASFKAKNWRDMPDLVKVFDAKLQEYEGNAV
jgi:hypothetical protein